MQHYNLNGVSGLVLRRRARQTSKIVNIYCADQARMDVGGLPWAVMCETHGGIVGCGSLSLAKDWAMEPKSWCEQCGGSNK